MVACPACGGMVGGVSVTLGIVRIGIHACGACGKKWRQSTLACDADIELMTTYRDALSELVCKSGLQLIALNFLIARIHDHTLSSMSKDDSLRKRRLDMWEKKLMKDLLGDSYE